MKLALLENNKIIPGQEFEIPIGVQSSLEQFVAAQVTQTGPKYSGVFGLIVQNMLDGLVKDLLKLHPPIELVVKIQAVKNAQIDFEATSAAMVTISESLQPISVEPIEEPIVLSDSIESVVPPVGL